MTATLTEPPSSSSSALPAAGPETAVPAYHRWTVEEYERLIELGALNPEDRVELLDGYILDKMDHRPFCLVGVASGRTLPLHRWTAEEYERWIAIGALTPDDKVELLDGYILDKMSEGPSHAHAICALNAHFAPSAAGRWVIRSQSPVSLGGPGLLEPDVALLRPPLNDYARRRPFPEDVFLLVEVSESTLPKDQGDKLRAYARAGIPEYWIINLVGRVVEVHRGPEPAAGRYRSLRLVPLGETLAPAAFPDAAVAVDELFG